MPSTSLLLVTSNGAGMGHLARQLAVGLAAGPSARVTLVSMSAALPMVLSADVAGEYIPGPDRDWIAPVDWAQYVAARLQAISREVEADVVVFDGVAPYRGVTLARSRMRDTPFVWFRRGMWRNGVNAGQLWKSNLFDAVIEPGDLASSADRGATADRSETIHVSPVSLLEVIPPLDRNAAATSLGLDPQRPTVLMTLGTGRLGDVEGPGAVILHELLSAGDWQVGLITSAIAERHIPVRDDRRIVPIRGVFPLVRYLKAFDAAVSAAGYNSVHELIPAGLPTLLVPNVSARTDDQVTRATRLGELGLGMVADPSSANSLRNGVRMLLSETTRKDLEVAIAAHPGPLKTGGAAATASILFDLGADYASERWGLTQRLSHFRSESKETMKRLLGPEGTNRVRRLLGRPPTPAGDRLRVTTNSNHPDPEVRRIHFSEEVTISDLLGTDPVEHILGGSSGGYHSMRRLLADRYYDIVIEE